MYRSSWYLQYRGVFTPTHCFKSIMEHSDLGAPDLDTSDVETPDIKTSDLCWNQ